MISGFDNDISTSINIDISTLIYVACINKFHPLTYGYIFMFTFKKWNFFYLLTIHLKTPHG